MTTYFQISHHSGGLEQKDRLLNIHKPSLCFPVPLQLPLTSESKYFSFFQVYQSVTKGGASEAYMRHKSGSTVTDMQFCPYEDILGVSTHSGYSSLIIPGMSFFFFFKTYLFPVGDFKQSYSLFILSVVVVFVTSITFGPVFL